MLISAALAASVRPVMRSCETPASQRWLAMEYQAQLTLAARMSSSPPRSASRGTGPEVQSMTATRPPTMASTTASRSGRDGGVRNTSQPTRPAVSGEQADITAAVITFDQAMPSV